MRKIKFTFIGTPVDSLDPKVQATLKAGLALLFDALSEIPGGVTPEVLGDLQLQLASYHPGNPAAFGQWLTDANALLQSIAEDTGNATFEKDAAWIGQITQLLAGGSSVGGAIFLSLFKKHTPAKAA